MGVILFVAFIVVPIVELYVIVQVAQTIGVGETIALLIGVSIAGTWLLKQQGLATWARLQASLARGEMPSGEVVDGALIMFGGALLLTPGFLSDILGLILLVPPTRALVKGAARGVMGRWARRKFGAGVYAGTVIRSERREDDSASRAPEGLPPEGASGASGDSPDRG